MENNNKILDELKVVSPLLIELKDKNPYTVPPAYFSHFIDNVLDKKALSNVPSFNFTKKVPYGVASNYFESLHATIVQKIKQEETSSEIFAEMESISPLLNKISKKPVYSIPENYFHEIETIKSLPVKKEATLISLFRTNKVVKYAAAAVVTGILAVGSFLFTDKKDTSNHTDTAQTIGVKQLSEEEILNFLKTTAPTENIVTVTNKANITDNDIKTSLSTVSDKEIQQFLRENGDQDAM